MDNLQNIGKHNTFFNLVSSERRLVNTLENTVCWESRYESNEIHNYQVNEKLINYIKPLNYFYII